MPLVLVLYSGPDTPPRLQHSTRNCPAYDFAGTMFDGSPTIYGASDHFDAINADAGHHPDDADAEGNHMLKVTIEKTAALCVRCKERIITQLMLTLVLDDEVLTHKGFIEHHEVRDANGNVVQPSPRPN